MTVKQWRNKHRQCQFCEHFALASVPTWTGIGDTESYTCRAKRKAVYPFMPRPFCRLFKLKYVEEGENK